MGMLDGLIKQGKAPKVEMEYIYDFHLAWPLDESGVKSSLNSIEVKKGIIVTDVVQTVRNGWKTGYDFTIKETGQRCHCNYPWAFYENTSENVIKIEEYRREAEKLEQQKKLVEKLRKNIEQL